MRHEAHIRLQQGPAPTGGTGIIYLTFENTFQSDASLKKLDTQANGRIFATAEKHQFKGSLHQAILMEAIVDYEVLIVAGVGNKDKAEFKNVREVLADCFKKLQRLKVTKAYVVIPQEFFRDYFEVGKQLALALKLTNYIFDKYKSVADRAKNVEVLELTVYNSGALKEKEVTLFDEGVSYGTLISGGISLTRDLVNEPASTLDPQAMADEAVKIGKESRGKIEVEVLDREQCRALGMGSYLSVAQGSDKPPQFVVLKYMGKGTGKKTRLCLVGKSIIFDTGGYSLKPSEHMMDMKIDMAGGATVLGLFKTLAGWNEETMGTLDLDIYGVLPICENMVSGRATRPGDIVTAMNGKTIEILNTDAEGRLILADGLVYAEQKLKADYIIDVATLTGACMVALGKKVAGMFGDNVQFSSAVESLAIREGDELWQLPLYKPYLELMKSDIAELKNIGGGRYGGAITAAVFLKEFVSKAPWIHIDIAGPAYNEDAAKGTVPKGGTGWGVMTLVELVRRWNDLMGE